MLVFTDIGGGTWSGSKARYPVDDGRYHIIRYKRHGSTSYLQVDDESWNNSTARGMLCSL